MFVKPGKAQIISATRALVRRRGYAEVSLRQIAGAARYSPAGLYAHFAGRSDILAAVADDIRRDLAAALQNAADGEDEPLAQLVEIGMAYIAFARRRPAEFELLFRHTRSRKRSTGDPQPSSFDLLRRIVRKGAPKAADDEVDAACIAAWATAHGLADLRITHLADVPGDWDGWARRALRAQLEKLLCPGC